MMYFLRTPMKKLRNYYLKFFLISLPTLYACSNRIVSEFSLDADRATVHAEILARIPRGSDVNTGEILLEENGFSCRESNGEIEFPTATFENFIYCEYSISRGVCSSLWTVSLLHKNMEISHALVRKRTHTCL